MNIHNVLLGIGCIGLCIWLCFLVGIGIENILYGFRFEGEYTGSLFLICGSICAFLVVYELSNGSHRRK
jgi:hypothetical protein